MPGSFEATLAAPAGFIQSIEKKSQRLGWSLDDLLERAGVSAGEYDAIDAALASVNPEVWRRLQNAVRSQVVVIEQTTQVHEAADGSATAESYGAAHSTHFGDLSG